MLRDGRAAPGPIPALHGPAGHNGCMPAERPGPRLRVLVCDDEPHVLRAVKVVLRQAGFDTIMAGSVQEALDQAAVQHPDAAILDLLLPDGDGVEVCRELRTWSAMPIIVLSAVGEGDQKVRALEQGADDYVVKPFDPHELVARLNAVLRRTRGGTDEAVLTVGGLQVDLAARVVRRDGEEVHLTPIEFDLLRVLARNRDRLMTHRALLEEVWGHAYRDDTPTLRTHMARLRAKIEPSGDRGRIIRTEPGVGYRLVTGG
jgi:two-component system, OmpR family, KDP operon response regulator KdpE